MLNVTLTALSLSIGLDGVPWLDGGAAAVRDGGRWFSGNCGALRDPDGCNALSPSSLSTTKGTDRLVDLLGPFSEVSLSWSPAGAAPILTTGVRTYEAAPDVAVLTQGFPRGLTPAKPSGDETMASAFPSLRTSHLDLACVPPPLVRAIHACTYARRACSPSAARRATWSPCSGAAPIAAAARGRQAFALERFCPVIHSLLKHVPGGAVVRGGAAAEQPRLSLAGRRGLRGRRPRLVRAEGGGREWLWNAARTHDGGPGRWRWPAARFVGSVATARLLHVFSEQEPAATRELQLWTEGPCRSAVRRTRWTSHGLRQATMMRGRSLAHQPPTEPSQATLREAPPNHTQLTLLVAGGGVSSTMLRWGDVMLAWAGGQKTRTLRGGLKGADPGLHGLSYYTDNGAFYYYQSANGTGFCSPPHAPCGGPHKALPPTPFDGSGYRATMEMLQAHFLETLLPVHNMQYDSWWCVPVVPVVRRTTHHSPSATASRWLFLSSDASRRTSVQVVAPCMAGNVLPQVLQGGQSRHQTVGANAVCAGRSDRARRPIHMVPLQHFESRCQPPHRRHARGGDADASACRARGGAQPVL